MVVEPLLFVPSPRDLPEFYEEFNKIQNYDKYFVRYTKPEVLAYDIGRDVFLENKKYTHMIICPDDLLIKQEHVDKLIKDIYLLKEPDTICIGGYCNLNTTDKSNLSNICIDRVNIEPYPNRKYNFATLQQLRDLSLNQKLFHKFIPVGFSGFPLFAIPRHIVEKIEFRNDSYDGWEDYGCCLDVMFCHDVIENGFEILCDLGLEMHHMKIDDNNVDKFMVDVKPRNKYFEYKIK